MAIDDNTSYELTGAQVKDLANKIKAKAADNIFVGATSAAPGSKGLVPQPQAGDNEKFLSGDGTWKTVGNDATSVTYYLQKQSTAGMSSYTTFIYTDSNRTTVANPATLVANFNAGKTILLEYEQTGAAEPYSITFQVNSVSVYGDPTVSCQYKLLISELNKDTGTYNAVTTQLSTVVTAGTTFNGRWTVSRAVIPTVPYENYLLSEINTGTTWIDGKPIYKKTFSFTLANADSTTVNHGISNFGLLIRFEGAAVSSSTKNIPIPRTLTNFNYQIGLEGVTTTSFEIDVGANGPRGVQAYVTLWYTKTTD